jgi:hypothetical protein
MLEIAQAAGPEMCLLLKMPTRRMVDVSEVDSAEQQTQVHLS